MIAGVLFVAFTASAVDTSSTAASALDGRAPVTLDYHNASFEAGLFFAEGVGSTTFLPSARVVLGPFAVEFGVPFTFADFNLDLEIVGTPVEVQGSSFRLGNIWLAGFFRQPLGRPNIVGEVGLGLVLPTAALRVENLEDLPKPATLGFALTSSGYLDAFKFEPESLGFYVPLRIESVSRHGLLLEGELQLQFLFPQLEDSSTLVMMQPKVRAGYRGRQLELTLQIASVVFLTEATGRFFFNLFTLEGQGDRAQVSLEPKVRWYFQPLGTGFTTFIQARLLMNLDEPLGFSFAPERFWGFFIGTGAYFR